MIENRHPDSTHLRDLLLLAATTCVDPDDLELLDHVDIVDVLGIGALLIAGELNALVAPFAATDRSDAVAGVMNLAGAIGLADRFAIGAAATVVGAVSDGDRHVAAAIARCLASFDDRELAGGVVALVASTLAHLAHANGVPAAELVRWSTGEADRAASRRSLRGSFCQRQRTTAPRHVGLA